MANRNWDSRGYGFQGGVNMPNSYSGSGMTQSPTAYPNVGGAAVEASDAPRVIYGKVTKLFQNFGYVDDEIFFMKSCVQGAMVRVGDRVVVEATYQPNMPIKWNAERVRLSDGDTQSHRQSHVITLTSNSNRGPIAKQNSRGGRDNRGSAPIKRPSNTKSPPKLTGQPRKDVNVASRQNQETDKGKPAAPKPKQLHPAPKTQRSFFGRYEVKIPKNVIDLREASMHLLKQRYHQLSPTPDFFHCDMRWYDVFPLQQPMKLGYQTEFKILPKEVKHPTPHQCLSIAPDADTTYSAKVMLLSSPSLAELYKQSCRMADEPLSTYTSKKQMTSMLQFLVGSKGKHGDLDAIGGPWSPSLDGLKPDEDPQVLVNTAVRTCRALTGIDLSMCTQWYRYLELHYLNTGSKETRVETVVVFIPDVWSCMPDDASWTDLKKTYETALENKLNPPPEPPKPEIEEIVEEPATTEEDSEENKTATHHSKLDPKTMKIADLRRELELRELPAKGIKANLVLRLQEAVDSEAVAEGGITTTVTNEDGTTACAEKVAKVPEKPVELTEKDRRRLEKAYTLGDKPMILVHPEDTSDDSYNCQLVSLRDLLDSKFKPAFEVVLFVQQFFEMIQRDCAFTIYKSIVVAPELEDKEKPKASEPIAKRRKIDGDSKNSEVATDKRSLRTLDTHLLFAFNLFDIGNCEYISQRDMESLFHSLGIALSRTQIRLLLRKVVDERGRVNYRTLTDGEVDGSGEGEPIISHEELDDADYILELASGNHALFEDRPEKQPAVTIFEKTGDNLSFSQKLSRSQACTNKLKQDFSTTIETFEESRTLYTNKKKEMAALIKQISDIRSELRNQRRTISVTSQENTMNLRTLRSAKDRIKHIIIDLDKRVAVDSDTTKKTIHSKISASLEPKKETLPLKLETTNDTPKNPEKSKEKTALQTDNEKIEDWKVVDSI